MSEICTTCGLPKDLCVCETIAKETQKVSVSTIKKKFGKPYTRIEGLDDKEIDLRDLTKSLKNEFACGGSIKDGALELQGNHKVRVKKFLTEKMGFPPDSIKLE
jgi:translation initiation factor 1